MASPLPTFFAGRFIGTILTPFYFATPENDWHTLIQPHIADWLEPRDHSGHGAFLRGPRAGPLHSMGWLAADFLALGTFCMGLGSWR